jgi:hypothetical protein
MQAIAANPDDFIRILQENFAQELNVKTKKIKAHKY